MRIYINNDTGSICLLTKINTNGKFQMEYGWGYLDFRVNTELISVEDYIEHRYTEIGYL
jgi:hypothetical protein